MGALSGPQSVTWGASGKRMVWGMQAAILGVPYSQ